MGGSWAARFTCCIILGEGPRLLRPNVGGLRCPPSPQIQTPCFCLRGFCSRYRPIAKKDPGNHYKIHKFCSNQSAVAFDCTPLTLPDGPGDGTEGRVPSSIEGGGMPAMARIRGSLKGRTGHVITPRECIVKTHANQTVPLQPFAAAHSIAHRALH